MSTTTVAVDGGFTGLADTSSFDTSSMNSVIASLSSELTASATGAQSSTTNNSLSTTESTAKSTLASITSGTVAANTTSNAISHSSGDAIPTSGASHGGISTGAKAGIGVGVALLCIMIAIGVLLVFRRRRRKTASQETRSIDTSGKQYGSAAMAQAHDDSSCLYHQKPELENTSVTKHSLAQQVAVRLNISGGRVAELEVC